MDSLASGWERHASGRASHRGHGGHRGGIEAGLRKALWWTACFWAGKTLIGRASHRGHGGHRGGLRLDCGRLFWWTACFACFWAGKTLIGRVSHRGHGGHRGGIEIGLRKALWWIACFSAGKRASSGCNGLPKSELAGFWTLASPSPTTANSLALKLLQSKEGRKRDLECPLFGSGNLSSKGDQFTFPYEQMLKTRSAFIETKK